MFKDLTEEDHNLIDSVLDGFDANKVAKIMEVVEWRWVNTDEKYPQAYEIRKRARELLRRVVARGEGTVGIGGLCAEYVDGYLELSFKAATSGFDRDWLNQEEPPF